MTRIIVRCLRTYHRWYTYIHTHQSHASMLLCAQHSNLLFMWGNCVLYMGLLYTKLYIDFDIKEWNQTSRDPVVFESKYEGIIIDVEDTSQKTYRLKFKKGGKLQIFRVTGKFRITWDDNDAQITR